MPKIVLPYPLSNNTTADADQVQANLDEIQTRGNALDDENIGSQGLNEVVNSVKKLFMDATNGHTHDGVDATEIAPGTGSLLGGFKYFQPTATWAGAGFSAELNQGTLSVVVMAIPLWANAVVPGSNSDTQHLEAVPAGYGGAASDLYSSRQIGDPSNTAVYVVLDQDTVPNRVWLFNTGSATKGIVLLIGT